MGIDTDFTGVFAFYLDDVPKRLTDKVLEAKWNDFSLSLLDGNKCDWTIDWESRELSPIINHRGAAVAWVPWLKHIVTNFFKPNKIAWQYGSISFLTTWGDAVDGLLCLGSNVIRIVKVFQDDTVTPTVKVISF